MPFFRETHHEPSTMSQARRGLISGLSIAILAIMTATPANAASVPFECPQEVNGTCFFVVFGPGFSSQMFELRSGQSKQVQATVGQDTYCYGSNVPPASRCPRKPVADGVNR
jgi:hypothetical protein